MTKKLIRIILSSWLLFSSLYLPAQAETATAKHDAPAKPLVKKSAQAQFLEGKTCLEQSNTSCAKLALALIPSMSPYAKILQGALAQQSNQTEQALLILLPLQSDENLTLPAKITLHRTLAQAFTNLGDIQQAVQHFISTEMLLKQNQDQNKDIDNQLAANQEQIWKLLRAQTQTDLIALRGNNTDSVFQGWIDLTLASLHVNSKLHVTEWRTIYPDHPAQAFAKNWAEDTLVASQADTQPNLAISNGVIALVLPTQDEADSESLQAFKLGLETSLNLANSSASIEVYYRDQTPPETIAEADYLITPEFKSTALDSHDATIEDKPTLHIRLTLQDEADTILSFIRQHHMQYATIVTTQHEASQPMLSAVQHAWSEYMEQAGLGAPNIISLDADIMSQPVKLLDLKSQLASQLHDIVILAMSAEDVLKIRPYLD
ncbi:MAG: penicillin-binding protein activator, partial [Methylotenera sp.]